VILLEFEGLGAPSTLLLIDGESRVQASDPDRLLGAGEAGDAHLIPGDPREMRGRERELGTYRVIGTYEDLPLEHIKIRAVVRSDTA
jgi:hypothetical protein